MTFNYRMPIRQRSLWNYWLSVGLALFAGETMPANSNCRPIIYSLGALVQYFIKTIDLPSCRATVRKNGHLIQPFIFVANVP